MNPARAWLERVCAWARPVLMLFSARVFTLLIISRNIYLFVSAFSHHLNRGSCGQINGRPNADMPDAASNQLRS
jgi:hypothetical protein